MTDINPLKTQNLCFDPWKLECHFSKTNMLIYLYKKISKQIGIYTWNGQRIRWRILTEKISEKRKITRFWIFNTIYW